MACLDLAWPRVTPNWVQFTSVSCKSQPTIQQIFSEFQDCNWAHFLWLQVLIANFLLNSIHHCIHSAINVALTDVLVQRRAFHILQKREYLQFDQIFIQRTGGVYTKTTGTLVGNLKREGKHWAQSQNSFHFRSGWRCIGTSQCG